jgi:phospholipid-translocating ATPase
LLCRLDHPEDHEEEEMVEKTQQNLDSYAKLGLRVLVMAKRVLQEEEYLEWLAKHRDAEVSRHCFGQSYDF